MFDFFRRYPWVLKVHRYDSQQQLMTDLEERVIRRAEAKVLELRGPQQGGTSQPPGIAVDVGEWLRSLRTRATRAGVS